LLPSHSPSSLASSGIAVPGDIYLLPKFAQTILSFYNSFDEQQHHNLPFEFPTTPHQPTKPFAEKASNPRAMAVERLSS
jgi:hypothetical protein